MINLLSKINVFIQNDKFAQKKMIFKKHYKFANKKGKGVISEKIKAKTWFADKDL